MDALRSSEARASRAHGSAGCWRAIFLEHSGGYSRKVPVAIHERYLAYTRGIDLHGPDRTLSYRCPRISLNQAHSTVADQRRRRFVQSKRYAYAGATKPQGYITGSTCEPHCETVLLTLHCQTTHYVLVPVEPVSSWCPISRSQYNWEEELSHQLKGEANSKKITRWPETKPAWLCWTGAYLRGSKCNITPLSTVAVPRTAF